MTDGDGDTGYDNLLVTVNNVAPSVNAGSDQAANEGDIVFFSGSFTDPGLLDTHTIEWDFGDGSKVTDTLTPEHAYGDDGEYTVILIITDNDGAVSTDTLIVTVNNVAPTVNAGPDQTIDTDTILSFNGAIEDPGWLDTHTIEWDFGDGTMITGTLTPEHVYRESGVYEITMTVTDDDGDAGTDTLSITVTSVEPSHGSLNDFFGNGFSLASMAVIAALLVCMFAGNTEVGRYRLIPFISPLYSRLKKEEVLDHMLRSRIFEHIIQNPGDHYNNIKMELGLNNGSLAYHLRTLEKEDFIKSRRDGIYKRFYPKGVQVPMKSSIKLSPMEKDIMGMVRLNPGIIQKDIAEALQLSQQIVSYHVNLMIESGLIRAERHGKTFRYYPTK